MTSNALSPPSKSRGPGCEHSLCSQCYSEEVVYAFPEVRPNTTVVQRDAVLARTALERDETNSEAVRNRLNLLLCISSG